MAQSVRDDRHQQHQAADLEDRALIALDDALVDDVRHQPRQQQGAERLRQREHQHDRDVSAIRLEKRNSFSMVVSPGSANEGLDEAWERNVAKDGV